MLEPTDETKWLWVSQTGSGWIQQVCILHSIYGDDDDDEIAYFTVRWKTRASFVYRTKNMR